MKNKSLYYAMLYQGIHSNPTFVKCFIPYDSLSKMLIVCNSAISTLFAVGSTGFLKIYRDKDYIGEYSYDSDSNTFTFLSAEIFPTSKQYLKQILKKNERTKQKHYGDNS